MIDDVIIIVRQGNEINIKLNELSQELHSLYDRVVYVMQTVKDVF